MKYNLQEKTIVKHYWLKWYQLSGIGFSFPIQVRIENDQYVCVDGHKRLTILEDILKEDPSYKRGRNVHVIIKNNGDQRSNDCSRGRNTH